MTTTHRQLDSQPLQAPDERAARIARERQAIEDAEAEADREGTIPFEEIRAWVESWGTSDELPPPEPRQ